MEIVGELGAQDMRQKEQVGGYCPTQSGVKET